MDNNSSVFEYKFLHMIHIFTFCDYKWTSWALHIFDRGHTGFEFGQLLKGLPISHCVFSKSNFNISKVFFPRLKQDIMQDTFLKSAIFLASRKS